MGIKRLMLETCRLIEALSVGQFLNKFDDWKDKSTDELANWFAANKTSLDKLKKEIPKKFQPPVGKKAYRGSSIPPEIATTILKKKAGDSPTIVSISGDAEEGLEKFIVVPNVPYTPHRKAQSWTLNKKVAADFSNPMSGPSSDLGVSENNVGVVYEATIDNSFYLNPKAFGGDNYSEESEILRIGGKSAFTLYIRLKDLPPNVALQYGGKSAMKKILDSYKLSLFKFLNQWTSEDFDDKRTDIETIVIDKNGTIQVQTMNGDILSVDDYFDRCEKIKKALQKISWRDGKTPYNRAFIRKKIASYERKIKNTMNLK